MSFSTTSSTTNVRVGPCHVTYNGVDLGFTQGGVEVTVKSDTHKVNLDQFGKSTVDEIIQARDISVKVPMAETTITNLVAIMPGATLVTGADPTHKKVLVTNGVGTSLLASAKPLILHPAALPASDKSEDISIPLANTAGDLNFAYVVDKERVFDTTFMGYPDTSNGNLLFIYGDQSVVAGA